jgi:cytochrome c-type biogenesis protein
MLVLLSFGLGHCAVIVGAGTVAKKVQHYLRWSDQSSALLWVKRTCGIFVILGGMYLLYTS